MTQTQNIKNEIDESVSSTLNVFTDMITTAKTAEDKLKALKFAFTKFKKNNGDRIQTIKNPKIDKYANYTIDKFGERMDKNIESIKTILSGSAPNNVKQGTIYYLSTGIIRSIRCISK